MNSPAQRLPRTIGLGALLLAGLLALAFLLVGVRSRTVHKVSLPVYGQVGDFTLTNQDGASVSLRDLRGKVWVADIIFTRCAGPCLRMSGQMKDLQDALPPGGGAQLVSLTTDPGFDTPAVLRKYGGRFGADPARWTFLTGTQDEIGKLAVGGLKLSAVERPPAERQSAADLFVHSTIFVAVDKQGRLRGIFETGGEGISWNAEKRKILAAISELEREP
jgi:protein SCO1/2